MYPYWLVFAVFAFGSLVFRENADPRMRPAGPGYRIRDDIAFLVLLVAVTLMIGFRYRVGGDWVPYQNTFKLIASHAFDTALRRSPMRSVTLWLTGSRGRSVPTSGS